MTDIFNKALGNFITEFACADAIRHMADMGMTVQKITERLDYPIPENKVAEIVWNHYINTGVVCSNKLEKVSYVKETGKYGRTSLRRIVEHIDTSEHEYIECDFGKRIYQDRDRFVFELKENGATKEDIDHVLSLPWPLKTVYHIDNDRIRRCIGKGNDTL